MKKLLALLIFLLLAIPVSTPAKNNVIYKKIAVYPSIVPAVKVLEVSLRYGWNSNGKTYIFEVSQVNEMDIILGKLKNYDAFVIGASGRQYLYGASNLWKEQVKKFIAGGGGYLGICGGANEASMGYENPKSPVDYMINDAVLKVANVYINDDQSQEWQYLYKTSGIEGGVPIKCKFTNNPILSPSPDNPRIIRYEGGPGMYPANNSNLPEVEPIAFYEEEPSEKAPIHHWYKKDGEWHEDGTIKTDIKGQYAGIITTYGKGRIILFGPHPEEPTMIGGHVEEFPGRTKYTLFREKYLYKWTGGNETPLGYNWWILRRSMAWACNIPDNELPPINETTIFMEKPNNIFPMIYVEGKAILPCRKNIVIGGIDVEAYAMNAKEVKFYVDGEEKAQDMQPPYKWHANLVGEHEIMVKALNGNFFAYDSMKIYFL